MNEDLEELAGRYREILRQAVYLIRAINADGELSTSHLSTLNMVAEGPLRVGDIARNAGIKVPSATDQVIRLEAAGLVRRIPDPTDARAVLVKLTAEGRVKLEAANQIRNQRMAAALAALTPAERQAVADAIPAIAKLNEAVTAG